jgi:hypothetical protein
MPDTPIQFESERQFHDLPGYSPAMECTTEELDRIVGKYSWDAHRALRCGLNRCNTRHWNGFVIAAKDGRKTHCGHECGGREFGAIFKDVEAAYRRAEEDAARAANIAYALRQRDELLAKIATLETALEGKVTAVREVVSLINREPAMTKALNDALRNGGRIQQSLRASGVMKDDAAKNEFLIIDIGRIDAGDAVRQQKEIGMHVRAHALWPLRGLTADSLASVDRKGLAAKSSEITTARQAIQDGENFIELAARFIAPANLRELAKLSETLPAKARNQRVAKITQRLTQQQHQPATA